jgi:putative endonuclease
MPRPRPMLALMERSLALLEQVHDRLEPATRRTPEQQLGMDGERAAYFHLRRLDFIVVARRWTHATTDGDLDLIAWEGETLCFVEVKTRGMRQAFAAELSVDRDKQATLRRMADAYIRQLPWPPGQPPAVAIRFDVVSIYRAETGPPDIRMLRDFFR